MPKPRLYTNSTALVGNRATFCTMQRDPISESTAQKLGQVFQVSAADVLADAERLATWDGQFDDLLVLLEQRYGWSAPHALRYLVAIRSALEGELDSP